VLAQKVVTDPVSIVTEIFEGASRISKRTVPKVKITAKKTNEFVDDQLIVGSMIGQLAASLKVFQ